MSGDLDLEQRYRRVLRLLPGYYRDKWEEDMVAAFLDSWMTGDPDEDSVTMEYDRPSRQEIASVVGLAARLYLGGAGTPRRYFAWGQAVRLAVLAVVLVHATQGLSLLTLLTWRRHLAGWFPALPTSLAGPVPSGAWPMVINAVDCIWIVIFVALMLGHHRMARVVAPLAVAVDLVFLLQAQFAGLLLRPLGTWSSWFLLDFVLVLAMAAFHRDAPPAARRPWLLALPGYYLLVPVPVLVLQATGNQAWLPDSAGLGCLVVSLLCLAHAPRALSRSAQAADSGVWSLALMLLAGVAGVWRIVSLGSYVHDPHLIKVGRNSSGQVMPGPPIYQIMITLPAADVAAATAVVTAAYDSRGGVDFSVAGRTWALPMVFRPFRSQQLSVALPSKNQALQLHRLLVSSG